MLMDKSFEEERQKALSSPGGGCVLKLDRMNPVYKLYKS